MKFPDEICAPFKKGMICWKVPVRFWDTQEPIRCEVIEDSTWNEDDKVLVYDEECGCNLPILRENLFFKEDHARRVAQLMSDIFFVRQDDEVAISSYFFHENEKKVNKEE